MLIKGSLTRVSIYQKGLNAQGGLTCLKEGLNAY